MRSGNKRQRKPRNGQSRDKSNNGHTRHKTKTYTAHNIKKSLNRRTDSTMAKRKKTKHHT